MKRLIILLAIALAAAGCGGDGDSGEPAAGSDTAASSQVPFDRAFIDAMIPHHREAIEMAKAAQARGLTEPELQQIARDVVSSQQREIDQMLEWREAWFGSRTLGPVEPEVLGVPEDELGMDHGTADEIASATDVDATFAELMTAHHEGAIEMAEAARDRAQHDEVEQLAAAIVEAQEREVEIMAKHASAMEH